MEACPFPRQSPAIGLAWFLHSGVCLCQCLGDYLVNVVLGSCLWSGALPVGAC
jgi:hypothetical protein